MNYVEMSWDELDRRIEEAYNRGRADAKRETYGLTIKRAYIEKQKVIDECINILNDSIPLVDNMDIIYGFKCAIERLEQLKEE